MLFAGVNAFAVQQSDNSALALMDDTWRQFREIHPFGFQTVGLKHRGDTCVFVISEPSYWVEKEKLNNLFTEYGGQMIIRTQSYGYDGQLTDAIGWVAVDASRLKSFERELFVMLYGTDYKPCFTDLDNPKPHVYYAKQRLDFIVTNALLKKWLIDNNSETFNCEGKGSLPVKELLRGRNTGTNEIHFSRKPGFVAWILDPQRISDHDSLFRTNARKFALDTDLILGAVYHKGGKIAIIGREREVPVNVLPPLRAETIEMLFFTRLSSYPLRFESLASQQKADGSYQCPICMDQVLRNTELGNLFVLTDMMLKSWSENADVYDLCVDYPKPEEFPFANRERRDTVHNRERSRHLYYLWGSPNNRTGCQSVHYTPSTKYPLSREEIISTEYFAWLNNVDLVRCTQYMTLYEIFRKIETVTENERDNSGLDSESWLITPTLTMSNAPWGWGGHFYPWPKPKIPRMRAGRGTHKPTRPPQTVIYSGTKNQKHPTSLPKRSPDVRLDQLKINPSHVTQTPSSVSHVNLRESLITIKQRKAAERGMTFVLDSQSVEDSNRGQSFQEHLKSLMQDDWNRRFLLLQPEDVGNERVIYVYNPNHYDRYEYNWAA